MIRGDESPVAAESVNAVLDRAAERWPTQDAIIERNALGKPDQRAARARLVDG